MIPATRKPTSPVSSESLASRLDARPEREERRHYASDKLYIMSGLDEDRRPPQIGDTDLDMDARDLRFNNCAACQQVGRKKLSDIDIYHAHGGSFAKDSTRQKGFENSHRRAVKNRATATHSVKK